MKASDSQVLSTINEFASTLTHAEKQFMDGYLTSREQESNGGDGPQLTDASIWQRRHRIRSKLQAFLADLP